LLTLRSELSMGVKSLSTLASTLVTVVLLQLQRCLHRSVEFGSLTLLQHDPPAPLGRQGLVTALPPQRLLPEVFSFSRGQLMQLSRGQLFQVHRRRWLLVLLQALATVVASQGTPLATATRCSHFLLHHLILLRHRRWCVLLLQPRPSAITIGLHQRLPLSTTSPARKLKGHPTSCLVPYP
jgi:hypothetical protein